MKTISVSCAIIIHQNKILAAKRSEKMSQAGFWEFPGGKLEEGESPEESLIREIQEELGMVISIIEPLSISKFNYTSEDLTVELIPFTCHWVSGEIQILEHEEVQWLTLNEMDNLNWAPADVPVFMEIKKNWQAFRSKTKD